MNITEILDKYKVSYRRQGESHHVTSNFIGVDCCHCSPDSGKFHLGFSLTSKFCTCWSCGYLPLVKTLCELTGEKMGAMIELVGGLEGEEPSAARPTGTLRLPASVGPMQAIHKHYLRNRGFDPKELARVWGVQGIGLHPSLAWRLLIPIHYKGKIVSWTTRAVAEDVPIRYISANPEEEIMPHRSLLFGEDYVRHTAVIVEGPLDAARIGPGAVATFGISWTEEQAVRLLRFPRRVIIFDEERQAQTKARALSEWLTPHKGETIIARLRRKDPGSLGAAEVVELRQRFLS